MTICELDLLGSAAESGAVQQAALGPVPPDRFAVLARHVGYPGFAAYGAFDRDRLVGYTYGARALGGQWWFDQIATALDRTGQSSWLTDAHAVTELHVLPAYQGSRVGYRLLTTLLAGVPEPRVLLSTYDLVSPARRFYRRIGFADLVTDFRFEVTTQPFAIMGAALPLPVSAVFAPIATDGEVSGGQDSCRRAADLPDQVEGSA